MVEKLHFIGKTEKLYNKSDFGQKMRLEGNLFVKKMVKIFI